MSGVAIRNATITYTSGTDTYSLSEAEFTIGPVLGDQDSLSVGRIAFEALVSGATEMPTRFEFETGGINLLPDRLSPEGVAEAWAAIEDFRSRMQQSGELEEKRRLQASDWMWTLLTDDIKEMFLRDRNVEALLGQVQDAVANGTTTPSAAARRLLEAFKRN